MQANLILSGSNPTSSKALTGPSSQPDLSFEAIFGMIAPQPAPARPDGDLNALPVEASPVPAETDEGLATDLEESAEPSDASGPADLAVAGLPPASNPIPAVALPSTQEDGFDFNDLIEGYPLEIGAPSGATPPEKPANSQLIVVAPNESDSVENSKIETIIPSSFEATVAPTYSVTDRAFQSIDQTAVRYAENGIGRTEGLHPREQKLSGEEAPSRSDASTLPLGAPNKGARPYFSAGFAVEAVIDNDALEKTSLKLPHERSGLSHVANIFSDVPGQQSGDRAVVTSKQVLPPYSAPQEANALDLSPEPLNVLPEKPSAILTAYKTDGDAVVPSAVTPSKVANNEVAAEPARAVLDDPFVNPPLTGRADAPGALPPPTPILNGLYTEVSPAGEQTVNFGSTEAMVAGVDEQTIKRADPSDILGKAVRTPPPEPVRQIADAIVLTKNGTIEIMLEPVELGRVTLILGTDSSMSVGVIAERPETMDLIRRHSDQLLRDLRDSGMQDARLDFLRQDGKGDTGGGSAPPWNRGAGNSGTASTGGTSPLEEPEANSNNAPSHLGRLDIRL